MLLPFTKVGFSVCLWSEVNRMHRLLEGVLSACLVWLI